MSYLQGSHGRRSMMSKANIQSVYGHRRSVITHKPSLDLQETEFEEDYSDLEEYSGRRSDDSSGQVSATTLDYDELRTPATQHDGFPAFSLPTEESKSMKAVEGPVGPHLFRLSQETSQDVDIYLTLSPPGSPEEQRAPPPQRRQQQQQQQQHGHRPAEAFHEPPRTSVPLRTWTPQQVAEWMYSTGFDRSICDTFFINDISGITLIDLQYDDLKELGITSFGQRHRLWAEIRALKELKLPSPNEELCYSPAVPHIQLPKAEVPVRICTPETPLGETISPTTGRRRGRRRHDDIISPAESASIVAIEQLLPKPHNCSKGENCSKWRKQQKKLALIATEFPNEMAQLAQAKGSPVESGLGASVIASVVPSIVASSDLLGSEKPKVRLEETNLRAVRTRDPQENVKQFLQFQHVDQREDPTTPPYEMFPPLSPPKAQQPHANLASLPKLTIPTSAPINGPFSPTNLTAKPARNATPLTAQHYPAVHDIYRIGSPASEMDVPVTAIPLGPIERDFSSSVPPDMRYGNADVDELIPRSLSPSGQRGPPPLSFSQPFSPIKRSASQRHSKGRPSIVVHGMLPQYPVAEDVRSEAAPTEIADDRDELTPTAEASAQGMSTGASATDPNAPQHQGWMKKRRTRLLRHEWHENHFRLRGTQLAMHKDDAALDALEYVDVDDYAVAISASHSKLNSAMKRLRLNGGRQKGLEPGAFAFQLTPARSVGEIPAAGKLHAATGKTHHFAVKTQTERIDWMRELMLARARRGRGFEGKSFE
ncbi:MAG: hypothetical protein LQ340_001229 [Diploschistes diacapsis]|nr:MAG: hypothetical protein LQ340_001229 [Diploschistes diacapsis]